jgi:hypothetical protein
MATADGPYVTADGTVEYVSPLIRGYEAPTTEETARFRGYLGWAPTIDQATDPSRLQQIPLRDYRPVPDRPASEWWDAQHGDITRRESVTRTDADGWQEEKRGEGGLSDPTKGAHRFADDPRWTPPPEDRPTMKMSPSRWSFVRPFGENFLGIARQFNGLHFSMATNRRTYEILGMAPARSLRNTYRIEPSPWDENVIDRPANVEPDTIPGRINAVEVPPSSARTDRTWRLM